MIGRGLLNAPAAKLEQIIPLERRRQRKGARMYSAAGTGRVNERPSRQ
jgi:hypothetical protein